MQCRKMFTAESGSQGNHRTCARDVFCVLNVYMCVSACVCVSVLSVFVASLFSLCLSICPHPGDVQFSENTFLLPHIRVD